MKKLILLAWILLCLPGIRADTIPSAVPEQELSDCVKPILECPNVNITFHLYTNNWPRSPKKLDTNNIATIDINPENPVKLLIHGYRGNKNDNFNTVVRTAYFKRGEYSIISMDYESLVRDPCYEQGALNSNLVAVCLADFLDFMAEKKGLQLESVHLVGFDFGAQIAGFCTHCLTKGRIGRITGLDPSLHMFTDEEKGSKLDPADAIFVDVIHTNAGRLGQVKRLGDVDFYVNGGILQPGCGKTPEPDECSHNMAPVFFAESITSTNGFWGSTCRDTCGRKLGIPRRPKQPRKAILMGEDVPISAAGTYCVDTLIKAPFAKGRCDMKRSHTILYDLGGIVMVIMFLYFTVRYFYSV